MTTSDSQKMEQTLQQIEDRIRQTRDACQELLISFEQQERASYHDMLDKMSFITGEMSGIQNLLKKSSHAIEDFGQLLRTHLIVPRQLSAAADPALQHITEGRLITCDAEVLSTVLNTRMHIELEEEERKIESDRGNRVTDNLVRQVQSYNKNLDTLIAKLHEVTRQSAAVHQKSLIDYEAQNRVTDTLVRAMMRGIGIKAKTEAPAGGQPQPGTVAGKPK